MTMKAYQNSSLKFAICVKSDDPDLLTPRMVYQILPDEKSEKVNYIRVIDNEGEDYLYPADCFISVDISGAAESELARIIRNSEWIIPAENQL